MATTGASTLYVAIRIYRYSRSQYLRDRKSRLRLKAYLAAATSTSIPTRYRQRASGRPGVYGIVRPGRCSATSASEPTWLAHRIIEVEIARQLDIVLEPER